MSQGMIRDGKALLKKLEEAGHEAYFVGGYVRDTYLKRGIKDIDIATSALPEQVIELFDSCIPTGLHHGTVTVMIGSVGFEVTTFRKESEYEAHRRPSGVEFIRSLEEDLKRRDFTMNAMAMDRKGRIRDPFGGRKDLEQGILRCVGDPELRFREDALRMLRCIRFASHYDLEVEEATWSGLQGSIRLLQHVAMERVRAELERLVAGDHPYRGLRLIADSRLLRHTKVKLQLPWVHWTVQELPDALASIGLLTDPAHRWMLLAHLMSLTPTSAVEEGGKLTFSSKQIARMSRFLSFSQRLREQLDAMKEYDPVSCALIWKENVVTIGSECAEDWLGVFGVVPAALPSTDRDGRWTFLLERGRKWLQEMPVRKAAELALNGQQLAAHLKRDPGPWLGRALMKLTLEAAVGHVPNNRKDLLVFAESLTREWKNDA
ncbi:CCA tRNA nucleotidyltransferase [Paenibacillus sp. CC-CFT747]|nr:CCA tRNA nucleotidyltransferase [Paenibacillus sp. CC-CFT747]